jgi:hypothetical protein
MEEERIDEEDLLLQSEVSELPPDNHRKNCENEMSPLSSLLSDASNPNSIREIYCGVIDTNADNTDSHASQESIDAGLLLLLSV